MHTDTFDTVDTDADTAQRIVGPQPIDTATVPDGPITSLLGRFGA